MVNVVPDFTSKAHGVCHCRRLGLSRKEGSPDVLVDLTLVFGLDHGEESWEELELPAILEHARDALESAVVGKAVAKVQHQPETEGRASLWVLVDEQREQLCHRVKGWARKVVLHAEQKAPRVVWTVRIAMPQSTAGMLVGALEEQVYLEFEPAQAGLPLVPAMPPKSGGRAEA
jgi:hypothetical protein